MCVWIFQEIALARRALVVSREKSLEWNKISYVNDWIGRVSGRLRARKAKKPAFLGSTAWIRASQPGLLPLLSNQLFTLKVRTTLILSIPVTERI